MASRRAGRRCPTPHGDRKHAVGGGRVMSSSLPSWGSETASAGPWRRAGSRPHYPSWGSETTQAASAAAVIDRRSLPLMGIGNSAHVIVGDPLRHLITPHGDRKRPAGRRGRGAGVGLITPHGDRKPQGMQRGMEPTKPVSLPLMGIGNLDQRRLGLIQLRLLITPHGDRKLPMAAVGERRYPVSLPLMGIGNTSPTGDSPSVSLVSLPLMGIGNRASARQGAGRPSSHYPSWGSETPEADLQGNVQVPSLPLMGIGNMNSPSTATIRQPYSLPLMGIGNWSRMPPGRQQRLRCSHYPSWGSETRVQQGEGEPMTDSLPLMGIGNWAAFAAGLRPLVVLITPHGDRKPG